MNNITKSYANQLEENVNLKNEVTALRQEIESLTETNNFLMQTNELLRKSNVEVSKESYVIQTKNFESRNFQSENGQSKMESLEKDLENLKKLNEELEEKNGKLTQELESIQLNFKGVKEKLDTTEQNLSYMFKRSLQLSDKISDFVFGNFPDRVQKPAETHTIAYDKLLQYTELIFSEFGLLKKRASFIVPPQNTMTMSMFSTQKLGAPIVTERNFSRELSSGRVTAPNAWSSHVTQNIKQKTPVVYKPTITTLATKQYQTERLSGISMFAKQQIKPQKPPK